MSWKTHIEYLRTTVAQRSSILKTLAHLKWGADRKSLLRIYKGVIRAKLDYGCQIYSSVSESLLDRLNPLHNSAIRQCIGGFKSSPVVSLYAESNEAPLKHRRAQLLLQHYVRLQRLPGSLAHNVVFSPIVREPYQDREHL